jgi:internalin A
MTEEELLSAIAQSIQNQSPALYLNNQGLTELPLAIAQLTHLQELDLRGNHLTALPPELGALRNLRSLNLRNNHLTYLPDEIAHLIDLRSLDLRNNHLTQLPAAIGQLKNLRSLDLDSNQLSNLPTELGQLSELESIDLSENYFDELPDAITQLRNLRSLDLDGNQLSELPNEIVQLVNLRSLDLDRNYLSELPTEIVQLVNLRSLDLDNNQLTYLPAEIVQLVNLRSLDLSRNQLSEVPAEIVHLTQLESLYLSENELSELPAQIIQLTQLESLDLSENQFTELPLEVTQLTNLRSLEIYGNRLVAIPPEIAKLTQLESLDLRFNNLVELPAEMGQMQGLRSLYLNDNELKQIPREIGQMQGLRSLYLSGNYLTHLPIELTQLNLSKLDLRDNPIPIPPEILGPRELWKDPGEVEEILDFYFRVQDPTETEPLYEAKLLIVGEGETGKTSLARKIQNEFYELDPEQDSTHGIDVIRWNFSLDNGIRFRVNIWDFGGQEIYHQTHQFFLTERSLYILVADTRKENTDFYYWLKVIELLSNNSPVLIVKNEKYDRQCEVNDRQLRGEFTNLEKVLATNLARNRGIAEIKAAIAHYITQLPHVGTPLPKLWVRIRAVLENSDRNTLTLEEFFTLCRANFLTDKKDMLRLSRYLHDLGVCLHFQADPVLKHTVILKPDWATSAVYQVLETPLIKENYGRFNLDHLAVIWSDTEYEDLRDELLHLMLRFKLCYGISGYQGEYIAPHLLSPHQPDYAWDATHNLVLRYQYDFMPKGILTRFIVEQHCLIEHQTQVWKSGVILTNGQARAEVIEYYRYSSGEIRVRIAGRDRKELLTILNHEFQKIHTSYERLQYSTLIPCNCSHCRSHTSPHEYRLEVLQKFLRDRHSEIQCHESYEMVNVRSLLEDIFLDQDLSNSEFSPPTTPQLFISYSHADALSLTHLQKTLKPLLRNHSITLWDDTQIQPGDDWRTQIETAIATAQIAILLVSTNFLASDFIAENELPPLLEAAKARGLKIIWIPLSASLYEETAIATYQAAHPPTQPLDSLPPSQQNQAWVEICKKIKAAGVSAVHNKELAP